MFVFSMIRWAFRTTRRAYVLHGVVTKHKGDSAAANTHGVARLEAERPQRSRTWNFFAWIGTGILGFVAYYTVTSGMWPLAGFSLAIPLPLVPAFPAIGGDSSWPLAGASLTMLFPLILAARIAAHRHERVGYWRMAGHFISRVRRRSLLRLATTAVVLGTAIHAAGYAWSGSNPATTFGSMLLLAALVLGTISSIGDTRKLITRLRRNREHTVRLGQSNGVVSIAAGGNLTPEEQERVSVLDNGDVVFAPVPDRFREKFDGIEDRLAKAEQPWMLSPQSHLDMIMLTAVDDATQQRRDILKRTNNLVAAIETGFDNESEILGRYGAPLPAEATTGPLPEKLTLHDSFGAGSLPQLEEISARNGCTIIGHNLNAVPMVAYTLDVTADEADVYRRVIEVLGTKSWDLWLAFEWEPNDDPDTDQETYPARLARLTIKRGTVKGTTEEDRSKQLVEVAKKLPLGHAFWVVAEDTLTGFSTLTYRKVPSLPALTFTADSLPATYAPDQWNLIPKGMNPDGSYTIHNLSDDPHILGAGSTSSGKSTAMRHDVISRRARGHDIAIFDGAKDADDLRVLKDHTMLWGTTLTEIANGLAMVYELSRFRRRQFKPYRVANWYDLPEEVRIELGIRPLTVYVDEYETTVDGEKPDGPRTSDDPFTIAQWAEFDSIMWIKRYMRKLAREARAAGIFLFVATQSPYAESLGSKLRNNLTLAEQLWSKKLTSGTAALALGPGAQEAMTIFDHFKQFGPKGLGITMTVDGELEPYRVPFAAQDEGPALLEALGVGIAQPWKIQDHLQLGLVREEDAFETRTEVEPPFDRLVHLVGAAPIGADSDDKDVNYDPETFVPKPIELVPEDIVEPAIETMATAPLPRPSRQSELKLAQRFGKK